MPLKARRLLENKKVVLASQSPRRRELLKLLCEDFDVRPSQAEEEIAGDGRFSCAAEELAFAKCEDIAGSCVSGEIVIACDTTVVIDGMVLGKPKDAENAAVMLRTLSGRTHEVISGVAIRAGEKHALFSEVTEVTFLELTDEDIAAYISTGDPFDKAGGYGIQGAGSLLVERINGDYFNVVGLPLSKLARTLEKMLG